MKEKEKQVKKSKLTPMMEQYYKVKDENPGCVVFFRMGDFYEIFGEDAKVASSVLDITLTARHKKTDNPIPMCGFPHHSMKPYLAKMVKAGHKIAICDQVSDPTLPGIVQRKVTQVVTAGTAMEESILNQKKSNYLLALSKNKEDWALAVLDSSTGEFKTVVINNLYELESELYRLQAVELLLSEKMKSELEMESWFGQYNWQIFTLAKWQKAEKILTEHFEIASLASFGIEGDDLLIEVSATVLQYVKEKQMADSHHINKIQKYFLKDYLLLDNSTLYNLEIFSNSYNGKEEGSLFDVIDFTVTSMGARLLQNYLLRPLNQKNLIEERLDAVEEIVKNSALRGDIRLNLKNLYDLERLVGRLGTGRANPKDLVQIKNILIALPEIKKLIEKLDSVLWKSINKNLLLLEELKDFIEKTILDEPSAVISDANIINDKYNPEVDELRKMMYSGKDYIRELQENEIKKTGISSLKIKFNKVFGYYIEITNSKLDAIPENYIRKQTLVNAERFITPELKEFEEKVLQAEDKLKVLEQKIYFEILASLQKSVKDLQQVANQLAKIDVFSALAELAVIFKYKKANINEEGILEIKDGRHPVIERVLEQNYISNDSYLDLEKEQIHLLTGPNMSGKSSYLRQIALITILAHIGSFVPVSSANISLVDKVFTRIGASDNLSMGKSTFMVEMEETAHILNNATKNSLVILDELGRGTSTYDGVSIAWAVTEYLHQRIGAKTLFATHYHELIKLEALHERIKNYSVMVDDDGDEVLFLYKIVAEGTDKSYGLHVGKLAGLPATVLNRAEEILLELEKASQKRQDLDQSQLSLFNKPIEESADNWEKEEKIINELKNIELNNLSPLEALNKINDWKNKL